MRKVHKIRKYNLYFTACGLQVFNTYTEIKTVATWSKVTCKNCLKTRDSITSGKDDINPI